MKGKQMTLEELNGEGRKNITLREENELEWLSEENKTIIRKQFFPPNATAIEMQYCISVAKSFNLNPILKQIYFVPRKSKVNGQWIDKIEPLAGLASFLTLAHRSGKFAGLESTSDIEETPVLINGKWTKENDLVATATAWRKDTDRPFVVKVKYSEYVQKTSQGAVTKFWKEKADTMLKKVAESQVLRKAFDITGLYAEEEIVNVDVENNHVEHKPVSSLNDIVKNEEEKDVETIEANIEPEQIEDQN